MSLLNELLRTLPKISRLVTDIALQLRVWDDSSFLKPACLKALTYFKMRASKHLGVWTSVSNSHFPKELDDCPAIPLTAP